MKTIAHRGGMRKEQQNSPEGVRLATRHNVDFVELDVVKGLDGAFHCAHGYSRRWMLGDCLAEISAHMGLIAHLKGRYEENEIVLLANQIARHLPLSRVIFASHHTKTLSQLLILVPEVRLARFGLFPAISALWKRQPWECCMINQLVLLKWHVLALQRRGYVVYASCVWEFRSRSSIKRMEVDGAFVNL